MITRGLEDFTCNSPLGLGMIGLEGFTCNFPLGGEMVTPGLEN